MYFVTHELAHSKFIDGSRWPFKVPHFQSVILIHMNPAFFLHSFHPRFGYSTNKFIFNFNFRIKKNRIYLLLSFTFPNVMWLQWFSMFGDTSATMTMTNEQYGGVHWIVNHLSVICNFTQPRACTVAAPYEHFFSDFILRSFFFGFVRSFLFLIFNVPAPGAHSMHAAVKSQTEHLLQ